MAAPPDKAEISAPFPNPSNATARAGFGKLWETLFGAGGLLGSTGNPAEARAALGIGSTISGRQRLVNGNFAINQLGVTSPVTLAAGAYGHDQWKAGPTGCTYSFATVGGVTTITITAGSLVQPIEGLNIEAGTYTVSRTGTAQGRVLGGVYAAAPFQITGVAGGSTLSVEFGTGTLSLVQVEPGTVVTPFERRPFGLELSLCQRYFQPFNYFGGTTCAANALHFSVATGVQMRATPTVTNAASGAGSASAAIYTGSAWFQTPVAANTAGALSQVGATVLLAYPYFGAVAGWPGSIAIAGTLSARL